VEEYFEEETKEKVTVPNKTAELSVLGIHWHHSRKDEKIVTARMKEWLSTNSPCDMISGIVRRTKEQWQKTGKGDCGKGRWKRLGIPTTRVKQIAAANGWYRDPQ